MANINIYVLRDSSTKEIIAYSSSKQFVPAAGQEQVTESVPEEDYSWFAEKYKFNQATGDLEIDGRFYYVLEILNDAAEHDPIEPSIPKLAIGGSAFMTITLNKKDLSGGSHTGAEDNDRVYIRSSGGDAFAADSGGTPINYIDLANGTISFRIYSATGKGWTYFTMSAEEIRDGNLTVLSD